MSLPRIWKAETIPGVPLRRFHTTSPKLSGSRTVCRSSSMPLLLSEAWFMILGQLVNEVLAERERLIGPSDNGFHRVRQSDKSDHDPRNAHFAAR